MGGILEINKNRYNQILFTNPELTPITGAAITFQIKADVDEDLPALVEKKNTAAGGDDTEIEDVALDIGTFRVKIDAVDTSTMDVGTYWCEVKAIISSKPYLLFQLKCKLQEVLI